MLRESGTDGNGGAFGDVAVPAGAVLLLDPVSPAQLLGVLVADALNGGY